MNYVKNIFIYIKIYYFNQFKWFFVNYDILKNFGDPINIYFLKTYF